MTLVAADQTSTDEQLELELLIREARRRQRRRRLLAALAFVLAAGGVYVGIHSRGLAPSRSLLAGPLHFPSLGPGGRCPATSGYTLNNAYFGGSVLGNGPVRVLLAQAGDVRRGRFYLGTSAARGWFALQTLWFAMPGYNGPFVVRGARLGKPGPIEVQPGGSGQAPGSGPIVVPSSRTLNRWLNARPRTVNESYEGSPATMPDFYPAPGPGTFHGYRTVPGSTWVKSPGCYAWQIDGRGFTEDIVVDAVAVYHG